MVSAEFDPQARMSRRRLLGAGLVLIGGGIVSACGEKAGANREESNQQTQPTETPLVNKHGEEIKTPFEYNRYNSLNFPISFSYPDSEDYNVLSTDDYYGDPADLILGPTYDGFQTTIDITFKSVPLSADLEDVGESMLTEMSILEPKNDDYYKGPEPDRNTFIGVYPAFEAEGPVDIASVFVWETRAVILKENHSTSTNDLYQLRMRDSSDLAATFKLQQVFSRLKEDFQIHS